MASCDPDDLTVAARCYNCVPLGAQSSVRTYLLCNWSNLPTGTTTVDQGMLWANRVVANGGAMPSANTISALGAFYNGLQTDGILSKMIAVNCIVPDNLIAALTPLIRGPGNDPWTNAGPSLFVAGDLTVNGLLGGFDKRLNTGINPALHVPNDTSFGLTAYNTTVASSQGVVFGCQTDGTHMVKIYIQFLDNNCYWDNWDDAGGGRVSGANAAWAGFISGNRTGAGATAIYKQNGVTPFTTIGSGAGTAGSRPNLDMYMYDYNNAGSFLNFDSRRFSFGAIHLGLTAAEVQLLYARVVTLRTALGGGLIP